MQRRSKELVLRKVNLLVLSKTSYIKNRETHYKELRNLYPEEKTHLVNVFSHTPSQISQIQSIVLPVEKE